MSIQGFSYPHADLVIWSADAQHAPPSVRALLSSRKIRFIPCFGSYNGHQELSYLTLRSDYESIKSLLCASQESILVLGSKDSRNRHKATLEFLDPAIDAIDLGRLYSVSVAEAHSHASWTVPLHQSDPFGELKGYITSHINLYGNPI